MLSVLTAKRSAVTFDIGAAGIRACQLQPRAGAPAVRDLLRVDRGLPEDPDETPAPPALDAPTLARLVGQGRFAGQDVALLISPPEVQFIPLKVPEPALRQSPERVQQALKWEVAQESRRAAHELEVRYWRLPPGPGQQSNVMAVLLPTAAALSWCDQLRNQRLSLSRIDVTPAALVRLAQQFWTPQPTDLWGVLDLGLRQSTLTVVVGQTPTYIRLLTVCAHQWTRQIARTFEISYSAAEQLKREHGVRPTGQPAPSASDGRIRSRADDVTGALSSVLRDSLRALAQEVTRCFSYMLHSYPEQSLQRLLLAGGAAQLRGLPELLRAELDIPVDLLASDPVAGAPAWERPLAGTRVTPQSAAVIGAGLLDLETP